MLLQDYKSNGLVARFLTAKKDLVEQVFEDGLDALRALLVEGEVSGISDNSITEIWDEAEEWYQSKNA